MTLKMTYQKKNMDRILAFSLGFGFCFNLSLVESMLSSYINRLAEYQLIRARESSSSFYTEVF